MIRDYTPPSPRETGAGSSRFFSGDGLDRPSMAAGLMVFALLLIGLQDGVVKLASSYISLWQFQFLRAASNLVFIWIIARFAFGTRPPAPKRLWPVVGRSCLMVTTMVFYFGGVPFLSLPELAAGLYVFPLFVVLLSAIVLGERVGPRRIAAVLAGFAGTLLILKPGSADFRLVSLMPVCAAFTYACMILMTRKLCREESAITLSFGSAVAVIVLGGAGTLVFTLYADNPLAATWPFLFTGWRTLTLDLVVAIVACSALHTIANISLARAYQSAESSWLAPFDYSYLIFATFWGFAIFGSIPDRAMLAGMALIAAAGSFVAWREGIEKRRREEAEEFFNQQIPPVPQSEPYPPAPPAGPAVYHPTHAPLPPARGGAPRPAPLNPSGIPRRGPRVPRAE